MLKLLKQGEVNDWDDSVRRGDVVSEWEFKSEADLQVFCARTGGKETEQILLSGVVACVLPYVGW